MPPKTATRKIFLTVLILAFLSANDAAHIESLVNAVQAQTIFPSSVSLSLYGHHLCGGSIITSRHILTAAHCLFLNKEELNMGLMQVRAGSLDRTDPERIYYIDKYYYHALYDPNLEIGPYDIAVLKLTSQIEFNDSIQQIPIARSDPPPNVFGTSFGWGKIDARRADFPERAYAANLRIMSAQECVQSLGEIFQPGEICTSTRFGVSTCSGDSGGPLVYQGELVGVVSYGSLDCVSWPNVFTSVAYFAKWIELMVSY